MLYAKKLVLSLGIAASLSGVAQADLLGGSVHVSNILGKLNVRSRGEAAAIAHQLGWGSAMPPPAAGSR